MKHKMNCFNCEMERACKSCSHLICRKKTNFTDIKMLKRQPPNDKHEKLHHYEGV